MVTTDPVYPKIGRIIQMRRKALKMKQEELAQKLGISRGGLANIETGRQNLLVHHLYKFATALELTPHELLPTAEDDTNRSEMPNLVLPSDLKSTLRQQVADFVANVSASTLTTQKQKRER